MSFLSLSKKEKYVNTIPTENGGGCFPVYVEKSDIEIVNESQDFQNLMFDIDCQRYSRQQIREMINALMDKLM